MSFELAVAVPLHEENVVPRWQVELRRHGLDCEFFPGFTLHSWAGGHLPARLAINGTASFPFASRYGTAPILAGFELDKSEYGPTGLTRVLPRALQRFPKRGLHVGFRTAMGRSVADLRLQCMAAATLAALLGGIYSDPQSGLNLSAADAIPVALAEADQFEANPADPRAWNLVPFTSWHAV